MEVALDGGEWQTVPLRGSWFTEAFEGPMSNLQRVVAGEDAALVSGVDDAIRTMALVEACYESSAQGGVRPPAELTRMRIDAHQHFWRYDAAEYGWIDDRMIELRRDFMPDDLQPLLEAAGIDGCVAVQARQTLDETRWLLAAGRPASLHRRRRRLGRSAVADGRRGAGRPSRRIPSSSACATSCRASRTASSSGRRFCGASACWNGSAWPTTS